MNRADRRACFALSLKKWSEERARALDHGLKSLVHAIHHRENPAAKSHGIVKHEKVIDPDQVIPMEDEDLSGF